MSTHTEQNESQQSAPQLSWKWVKAVSRDLYLMDQKPLLGFCKEFPAQELAKSLAKTLGIESLDIAIKTSEWKEAKECFRGVGSPFFSARAGASGISGNAFFIMSRQDAKKLFGLTLHLDSLSTADQSEDIVESFYHFLSIHTLFCINQLRFAENMSFSLHSYDEPKPHGSFLCRDILVNTQEDTLVCRLLMDKEFTSSWSHHFSTQIGKPKQLNAIPVTLQVEAGRLQLSMKNLLEIKPGDFLICDKMSYTPDDEKSKLLLTLDGRPVFKARLKAGSLKILEIPTANEEYDSMVDKIPPTSPIEGHQDFHEDLFEDDDDLEEDDDDADDTEEYEQTEHAEEHPASKPAENTKKASHASAPLSGQITAEDIPVLITIELAKITMSAQKLIEVQPGNLIDLDLSPEASVNLVTGGKIIGKGEILKIGDALGVRVLEIGV